MQTRRKPTKAERQRIWSAVSNADAAICQAGQHPIAGTFRAQLDGFLAAIELVYGYQEADNIRRNLVGAYADALA